MFNKTLNRPMFRRGGRAGGGIMTGVQRQGYAGEGDPSNQSVQKLPTEVEVLKGAIGKRPEIEPYPYKASDFFMGLGANILAAPGGQPILQTIGGAAKEPLNLMMKQNMSNTQGDRELALAMWKNMDEDTKTRMMKDAQYLVDQGVFSNIQEALKSEIYSKQKSPEDRKAARIKDLENIIISKDVGGSLTEVAQDIANHVYNIQTGVYDGAVDQNGNTLSFAKQKSYFKDGDVARQGTKEDGTMIYELTENGKKKYEAYEGDVVFDYRTGKLFKKQGTMLVEVTIGEKQTEE